MTNYEIYTDKKMKKIVPDGKIFRISFDDMTRKFRLIGAKDLVDYVMEKFSTENQNSFFVNMHGYNMPSTISIFNHFGYFPTGMIFDVLKFLKTYYGTLDVVAMSDNCKQYIRDHLTPLYNWTKTLDINSFEVSNISKNIDLRDYQINAIKYLIFVGNGRGLIEIPTAGGKSFILANYIWTLHQQYNKDLKYLIYVPNRQLVEQMYKDFIDYGYPTEMVTRLTSGLKKNEKYNPEASIIISNRQYLFKNDDKLPKIDVLINDEVHQSSEEKSSTYKFINDLDCSLKIGCSGTLPRNLYNQWILKGVFGRVVYSQEIKELQDKGYISQLKINQIKIIDNYVKQHRELLFNERSSVRFDSSNPLESEITFDQAYKDELEYINNNYERLYAPILEEIAPLNGNTLILFDRLEFGQNMSNLAKDMIKNKKISYLDGQTDVQIREQTRQDLENTNDNILFGQVSILSTGINIKNLSNLVLLVSTKSFSRILQSIGRTLRLHKDKECANLYDVSYNFKYSQKHLRERMGIYRDSYKKFQFDKKIIKEIKDVS